MVGPGFRGRVGVSFRVGFRVRVRFGVRQSKETVQTQVFLVFRVRVVVRASFRLVLGLGLGLGSV